MKCPYCGGDLIKAKNKLVCLDCGREGRAPNEEQIPEPEIKTFKSHFHKKTPEPPKPQPVEKKPVLKQAPQFVPSNPEIKKPEPRILKEEVILEAPKPEPKAQESAEKVDLHPVVSKTEKPKPEKLVSPPELKFEEIKNFSLKKDWRDTYKLKMVYPIILKNTKTFFHTFVANFRFNFQRVVDNLKGKKEV